MTKNTKAAGNRRENQVKDLLVLLGFTVRKPKVSLGPADLVAKTDRPISYLGQMWEGKLLIQVKANKGSPWMHFRKDERAELLEEADWVNGIPILVHWPPHGKMRWYLKEDWPS